MKVAGDAIILNCCKCDPILARVLHYFCLQKSFAAETKYRDRCGDNRSAGRKVKNVADRPRKMLSVHESFWSAPSNASGLLKEKQTAAAAESPSSGWDLSALSFVSASGADFEGPFSACTISGSFSSEITHSYGGVCTVGLERLVYTSSTGMVARESDDDRKNRLNTTMFLPKARTGWCPEGSRPTRRVMGERRINERNTAKGRTTELFVREPPLSTDSRRSAVVRKWEKYLASAEPGQVRYALLSRRWIKRWKKILKAVEADRQQEGVNYFHQKLGRSLVHEKAHTKMLLCNIL